MDTAYIVLYFVFGTIVGSFLNVVVLRYYLRSSLKGRSFCFSCGKMLHWFELIPVFSYIALRGHCSKCKSSISPQYILVELLTGILFAGLIVKGYIGLALIIPTVVLSLLVAILVYDIRHKIVPDALVYTFITLSFISLYIQYNPLALSLPSLSAFFAGPVLFLPFFFMWFFSKGTWMGLGDGKLVLGMGWFLGFAKGISAVALAFWSALIVVILFYVLARLFKGRIPLFKKKISRKTEIPFTPFLILGCLIVFYLEFNLALFIL